MRKLVTFIVLTALIAGCSSLNTFKKTKHLDFKPFAEYTISLAADIEYGLNQQRAYYLRDYRDDPYIKKHDDRWKGVRTILKGIVAYSVEVTTLGSSTLNGNERCGKLAEFLDEMTRPVLIKYPIVFNATPADLDNVALYLVGKIDSANAEFVMFYELVQRMQNNSFKCLVHLGEYRRGNATALEKMYAINPTLRDLSKSDKKLTLTEVQAIENRLLFLAQKSREFKEQLAPDLEVYRKQQLELDNLYLNARKQLRKSRITVIVWSRAHRDLARGIVDPARINIFDLTKKAIDTAL